MIYILYIISVVLAWKTKAYYEKNGAWDNPYVVIKTDVENELCSPNPDYVVVIAGGLLYSTFILVPYINLMSPIILGMALLVKKIDIKWNIKINNKIMKLLYGKECED